MAKSSQLIYGVLGGSVVLLLVAVGLSAYLNRPRPVPPQEGEPADRAAVKLTPPGGPHCNPLEYKAGIDSAASRFKIPPVSVETLSQPLKGGPELTGMKVLKPGKGALETAHLRLSASVEKLSAGMEGAQNYRADNLVLSITNKSDVPVAYRVVTTINAAERCGSKAALPHNALALRPHETARRTECLYRDRQTLGVTLVEVYEITDLGQRYLSKLQPTPGSPFDMRVAEGHSRGGLPACRSMPWRDLDPSLPDAWRTVIDFHARHDCDEYTMPRDYRPWSKPGSLPACGPP